MWERTWVAWSQELDFSGHLLCKFRMVVVFAYKAALMEAVSLLTDLGMEISEKMLELEEIEDLEWIIWVAHEYKLKKDASLHEEQIRRRQEEDALNEQKLLEKSTQKNWQESGIQCLLACAI